MLAFTIGSNISTPLYPIYQSQFHMNDAAISLLFALYAIFLLPTLLLVGPLSDQTGRKKVIIPTIFVMLFASLLFAFAQSEYFLYVASALQGIAMGGFLGTCNAFLLDYTPKEKRMTTMLFSSFFTMLGFGAGPGISGLVLQYIKWSPTRTPFFIHFIILTLGLIFVFTVKETVSYKTPVRIKVALGVPAKLRRPIFTFIAPAGFIFFAFNGIVIALLPLFVKNTLQIHNYALSGGLLFFLMLSGGIAQLLIRRSDMVKYTILGLVLSAIGSFLILAASPLHSVIILIVGIFVEGVGNGWTFKGSLALAGKISPPENRAQIMSSYYITAYLGFIVPIIGTGVLSVCLGLATAILILSVILTVAVLFTCISSRSTVNEII